MSSRLAGLLILVVLAGAGVGLARAASTLVEVKDVRVDRSADSLTVTVKATGSVPYEARTIGSPTRLVIDLEGAHYAAPNARWTPGVDPIREVRGSQWKPGVARVVVELIRKVGYRIDRTAEGLVVVLEPSPFVQNSAPASERNDLASDAPTIPPEFGPVTEVKASPVPAQPAVAEVKTPPVPPQPAVAEVKTPPVPAQPTVAEVKTPPVPAQPVQATTQDGRMVALHPDGAWKYTGDSKSPSRWEARPPGATLLLAGRQIPYGIWIDPSTWSPPDTKRNAAAEYEFVHAKGDGQAMVISHANSVEPGSWKQIVLENAKRVAPDARITKEEKTIVNGAEVLLLQTAGTAPAGPFVYYGYYYAGKQGAIQIITYTRPELLEQYLADFTRFLNGFVLLE
jgi:hypothetical protein